MPRGKKGTAINLPKGTEDCGACEETLSPMNFTEQTWKKRTKGAKVRRLSLPKEQRSLNPSLPRICMVSDFFYPRLGGVEMHIYQLSQCLILQGFKVVLITHYSGNRHGVRYMTNGLKIYYLPFTPFFDNCTLPTLYSFFPLIRKVLIRERIDIIHGHQATSNLAFETLFHGATMGYKVVYTDHSLFGFADAACIHINKVLKFFLSAIDHAICVSHTNKENLVLRAVLNPKDVSVINNAVDAWCFVPDPRLRPQPPTINIVILSRLTYRKGIDLLVHAIPEVCRAMQHVHFIIGGDGPKRTILEEMRESHRLHDRVELLGAVPHARVKYVLQRGHIFLNSSLTEAFCIAIVEAAACGLLVVSTRVGGVPEVLPGHMMRLCEPESSDLAKVLCEAVEDVGNVDPFQFHREVSQMYSWHDIAIRTEKVYRKVIDRPRLSPLKRLQNFYACGPVSGKLFSIFGAIDLFLHYVLEWFQPRSQVDIAPDFPFEHYSKKQNLYADSS